MADQTLAKLVNERNILTLLRVNGMASRASISRALGLTAATISRLTSDMLKRGLLYEVAATTVPLREREPGRPGISLAINPSGGYFLGVEIGVQVLRFVLLDLSTQVVEQIEEPVSQRVTPQQATAAIARVLGVLKANPAYTDKILMAGVTVPGTVTTNGFVVNLPILGWKDTEFQAHLSTMTDMPVHVENNANAAAFGAVYTQPDLPSPSTVFLKIATGCGGAVIVNGRLLRGTDGTAMELGHVNIADNGTTCSCGQKGCLETWVNLDALARSFLQREPAPGDDLEALPRKIATAFDNGDTQAIIAIDAFSDALTIGLVSLVNIFNPSRIVLGGVMGPVLECCITSIRTKVARRIIPGTRVPDIQLSALGVFECAIGAACIAHHEAFDITNVEISSQSLARSVGSVG